MSKNLFIPALGTELILANDWTGRIYAESRNKTLIKNTFNLGKEPKWGTALREEYNNKFASYFNNIETYNYTGWNGQTRTHIKRYNLFLFPKGTKLIVDRIYIRQGQENFDSITFKIAKTKDSPIHGRFWVKLEDANTMEIE